MQIRESQVLAVSKEEDMSADLIVIGKVLLLINID